MTDNKDQKQFIGIHFKCCNNYKRIYKNKENTAYLGACPICLKQIIIKIEKGGSESRFFEAN